MGFGWAYCAVCAVAKHTCADCMGSLTTVIPTWKPPTVEEVRVLEPKLRNVDATVVERAIIRASSDTIMAYQTAKENALAFARQVELRTRVL